MDTAPTVLPARRPGLVVAPQGQGGAVVKDPGTGAYYQLGPQEAFLFSGLDGRKSVGDLRVTFEEQFGEPLSEEDVQEFVEMAQAQGLVAPNGSAPAPPPPVTPIPPAQPKPEPPPVAGQSILYWRKSLLDPDRLFDQLEPAVRFVWTPGFVVLSALAIVAAGVVAWTNWTELVDTFAAAARWEIVLLVWLAIAAVTTCHEFAHGLTCKHYGGEVHEVGFLMMFFMPCFYCNVSDAWLLSSKWKRIWVTLAGPYCDLCLWAAAVFVWRVTPPGLVVNHLALVVMSVCGVRIVLNANPLLKLDGYYLLSDWAAAPNLMAKAQGHVKGWLRWRLWGGPRPAPEPRGGVLLAYGLASWLFPMSLLLLLFWAVGGYLASAAGPVGAGVALAGSILLLSGSFAGILGGEVRNMVRTRHGRTGLWLLGIVGGVAALALWEWEDRAHGQFRLRPATRAELRAEVAGFLREATADEGEAVAAGQLVVRLEVPHLDTRLAQKQAELREALARLRLLEVGPRPEEVTAQRLRVERAKGWRDLAATELDHARQAFKADLARLDQQLAECRIELEFARTAHDRGETLLARGGISRAEMDGLAKRKQVCETQLAQAEARRTARIETGTLQAEAELVRRESELAESRATLGLMEAGTRPEEIDAEKARRDRLGEEIAHLERLRVKQAVHSPVAGVVTTPRLREAVGKYFREGDLICVVEEPARLEAEIGLSEQVMARVRPGQPVELKLPVLPLETFTGKVDRIAPRAAEEKVPTADPSKVTVYCHLDQAGGNLRPGMTGNARINCGRRPLGGLMVDRALRYLRTDFWWW